MDTSTKTVGYKEGSGFTHAYNDEPVTFNPMEAYQGIRDVRCVMSWIKYKMALYISNLLSGVIISSTLLFTFCVAHPHK